jgi:hypothetical protein
VEALVEALVEVAEEGPVADLGTADSGMFVVGQEATMDFAVAERGCTFVEKVVLVVGRVVKQSFESAAFVAVAVVSGCYRRSSSSHSQGRILSMEVPVEGMTAEEDIVGWRPAVEVAAMVAGRWCWAAVVATSLGMVVTVVALEDIDHVIVQVLDMAVAVPAGNRLHNVIAAYRMDPIEMHCLCNSSRLLVHSGRQTEYSGIGSTSGAVREQEDRTWHQADCMCSKGAPQAYGRNIARQKIASREGQVVCLRPS